MAILGTLARGLEAVRRSSGDERDQARVGLLELFELVALPTRAWVKPPRTSVAAVLR